MLVLKLLGMEQSNFHLNVTHTCRRIVCFWDEIFIFWV